MGSNYSSSDMGSIPRSVLLPVDTKAHGALLTELLAHAVSFTDEVAPPHHHHHPLQPQQRNLRNHAGTLNGLNGTRMGCPLCQSLCRGHVVLTGSHS